MNRKEVTSSWTELGIDDIAQAAYLVKNGTLPIEIVPIDRTRCRFVFQNIPGVVRLLAEWKLASERSFYIYYRELLAEAYKLQKAKFGDGQ